MDARAGCKWRTDRNADLVVERDLERPFDSMSNGGECRVL